MILNDSILTENGDEIIFQTVPLYGLVSVSSFSDVVTGLGTGITLQKWFAYSFDGIVYTDWIILTDSNLSNNINPILTEKTSIVIRFRYKLVSIVDSPTVELISLEVEAEYSQPNVNFPIASRSLYKDIVYDNIDVYNLMVNLVEKLYERGIVPEYFVRNEESNDIFVDKDYIEFWSTIAGFFSIFIVDAFKFTNIYFDISLLSEFLKQKGIFFNNNTSLIDLQLIAQNYYDEIRQRGGFDIFRPKGFEYPIGKRNGYRIPAGYEILPSTPVEIDGIAYNEVNNLPYGWTIQTYSARLYLIAPDLNYHNVLFPASVVIDILPLTTDSGIFKKYDGEYLRLIDYSTKDEFMFNQVNLKDLGWNFGNSSPFYKGLRIQYNKDILKAYEASFDFFDLSNYPIL